MIDWVGRRLVLKQDFAYFLTLCVCVGFWCVCMCGILEFVYDILWSLFRYTKIPVTISRLLKIIGLFCKRAL